jgi:hypothetical protein
VLMSQATLFIKRAFSVILPASRTHRSHPSHWNSRGTGPHSGDTIISNILNAPTSAILRGILCQLATDLTIGRYSNPRNQTNYWSDCIKYFSSFLNEVTSKRNAIKCYFDHRKSTSNSNRRRSRITNKCIEILGFIDAF